jgi:hypothetical protein
MADPSRRREGDAVRGRLGGSLLVLGGIGLGVRIWVAIAHPAVFVRTAGAVNALGAAILVAWTVGLGLVASMDGASFPDRGVRNGLRLATIATAALSFLFVVVSWMGAAPRVDGATEGPILGTFLPMAAAALIAILSGGIGLVVLVIALLGGNGVRVRVAACLAGAVGFGAATLVLDRPDPTILAGLELAAAGLLIAGMGGLGWLAIDAERASRE